MPPQSKADGRRAIDKPERAPGVCFQKVETASRRLRAIVCLFQCSPERTGENDE
jgi:hypothetical protein